MARNQISFFATKSDLEPVLRAVEANRPLQYVPTGLFDTPTSGHVESLLAVPDLGIASVGDSNHETAYLVADRGAQIEIRNVPQRRGGVKYAVDQLANPKTIAIRPGGVFKNGRCLIASQMGTASDDKDSVELFKLFRRELTTRFEKIKSFYSGAEACTLLANGWRLTTSVNASAEYDLKRH